MRSMQSNLVWRPQWVGTRLSRPLLSACSPLSPSSLQHTQWVKFPSGPFPSSPNTMMMRHKKQMTRLPVINTQLVPQLNTTSSITPSPLLWYGWSSPLFLSEEKSSNSHSLNQLSHWLALSIVLTLLQLKPLWKVWTLRQFASRELIKFSRSLMQMAMVLSQDARMSVSKLLWETPKTTLWSTPPNGLFPLPSFGATWCDCQNEKDNHIESECF